MPASVKVSGVWRNISRVYVRVSGTWREVQRGFVRVSGTWVEVFAGLFYQGTLTVAKDPDRSWWGVNLGWGADVYGTISPANVEGRRIERLVSQGSAALQLIIDGTAPLDFTTLVVGATELAVADASTGLAGPTSNFRQYTWFTETNLLGTTVGATRSIAFRR